jgi:thiamine kinase-like enzyme
MGELGEMLAQLEPSLGPLRGEPQPLEGGITNRNFRVTLGDAEYVLRRHGRETELLGIDREAERAASEAAAGMGIAPKLVATVRGGLVSRFVNCVELSGDELRARVEQIALALRRFHDSPLVLGASFWVPDLLERYAEIATTRGATLPPAYRQAQSAAAQIASAVPLGVSRPCHNDLLPGNIIRAAEDDSILIVDWEYAGMGHPYFDLGNLAVNNGLDEEAEGRLLRAYEGAQPGDRDRARLRLMRVISDAREAAWGVVQSALSDLDFDFDGYAALHFERMLAAVEGPDFGAWLAAA